MFTSLFQYFRAPTDEAVGLFFRVMYVIRRGPVQGSVFWR